MKQIMPGSRVKVFDHRLFIDDVRTPLGYTMRKATVISRYGCEGTFGRYPDLIDVRFDYRPDEISHGHFTEMVEMIEDRA